MKKNYCLTEEIPKTYQDTSDLPNDLLRYKELTYDNIEYKNLSMKDRTAITDYEAIVKTNYLNNGLSQKEQVKRLERDGPNKLQEKKKTSWIVLFIHEITSAFSILLWIGGALAMIAYGIHTEDSSNLYLAFVLWLFVIISAGFTIAQNLMSESILESFKSFENSKCLVIRDGTKQEIFTTELVVGDVCLIKNGDKIPADIRIFEHSDLSTNNSTLTGESKIIKLGEVCHETGYRNPLEAKNIGFFFTIVSSGEGKGVVIKTGKNTYMGKLAELADSAASDTEKHSLENETNKYIRLITVIAISFGLAFFLGGVGVEYPVIQSIVMAIGVIVANVPEGLLSCLTVALALNCKILFKKGLLIKKSKLVETLGAVSCICIDKTGTVTKNKMNPSKLWYDMDFKVIDNSHFNFNDQQEQIYSKDDISFKYLQFAAVCGSESIFLTETPEDYVGLVKERNSWQQKNPSAKSNEVQKIIDELKLKYQKEYDNIYNLDVDSRRTNGDADEEGFIKFFEKFEDIRKIRSTFPQFIQKGKEIKLPFNPEIRLSGYLREIIKESLPDQLKDLSHSNYLLAFKGAPENLIKKCKYYLLNGKKMPIDEFFINRFKYSCESLQLEGLRVFGFAYKALDPKIYNKNFSFVSNDEDFDAKEKSWNISNENDLVLIGLIASEDPPRYT
jgi:sodium/potassium-transporting ATPase subunit alpha